MFIIGACISYNPFHFLANSLPEGAARFAIMCGVMLALFAGFIWKIRGRSWLVFTMLGVVVFAAIILSVAIVIGPATFPCIGIASYPIAPFESQYNSLLASLLSWLQIADLVLFLFTLTLCILGISKLMYRPAVPKIIGDDVAEIPA